MQELAISDFVYASYIASGALVTVLCMACWAKHRRIARAIARIKGTQADES